MPKKKNDALFELKRQIKDNALKPLYLLFGEETFLRDLYCGRITAKIPDAGFEEFNHIKLEGNSVPLSEYDDAIESFPMMTDKKLILIKDSGIFEAPKEDVKTFWLEKFSRLADDTVIVFSESKVDKRSATYKAAAEAGMAVEFEYLSEADLVTWVGKQCLDAKVKIDKSNSYYLISLCDPGLNNLNNELKKLLTYCDKEILKSDIDRVVSKSLQVVIFELTDSIMAGDAKKALAVMADLKTNKEDVVNLLGLLFSAFEKMLHIKLMGYASMTEIMSAIGVKWPSIARKYIDGAKGFSEDALVNMVTRAADINMAIREGRVSEWTALEQYIIECIHFGQEKEDTKLF